MPHPLVDLRDVPLRIFDDALTPVSAIEAIYGPDTCRATGPLLTGDRMTAAVRLDNLWWSITLPGIEAWQQPYWRRVDLIGTALSRATTNSPALKGLAFQLILNGHARLLSDWDDGQAAMRILNDLTPAERASITTMIGLHDGHGLARLAAVARLMDGWTHRERLTALLAEEVRAAGDYLTFPDMSQAVIDDIAPIHIERLLAEFPAGEWAVGARTTALHMFWARHLTGGEKVQHAEHGTGTVISAFWDANGYTDSVTVDFTDLSGRERLRVATAPLRPVENLPARHRAWIDAATPLPVS